MRPIGSRVPIEDDERLLPDRMRCLVQGRSKEGQSLDGFMYVAIDSRNPLPNPAASWA